MTPDSTQDPVTTLLADLNGGVFLEQLHHALKQTAIAVAHTGKKGSVSITLDLKRIGETMQVECRHTLAFNRPTAKGKATEESSNTTPLYVSSKGELGLFPFQDQASLFGKQRESARAGQDAED